MKVFFHYFEHGQWNNSDVVFEELPRIGDHVALDFDSPWYRITLVVHNAFDSAKDSVEVYAVRDEREPSRIIQDAHSNHL